MTGVNESEMNEARFARLVEAYGAEPARWPAGERPAAQRLLSSSTAAQHVLAQARALDQALVSAAPPSVSLALENRLLTDFDGVQLRWSLRKWIDAVARTVWPGAPLWQPAAVFGLALAIGIGVAVLAPLDLRQGEDNSASVFALDAAPDIDAGQGI
jgi:hypothetical protein